MLCSFLAKRKVVSVAVPTTVQSWFKLAVSSPCIVTISPARNMAEPVLSCLTIAFEPDRSIDVICNFRLLGSSTNVFSCSTIARSPPSTTVTLLILTLNWALPCAKRPFTSL